jgi:hypothetical protein
LEDKELMKEIGESVSIEPSKEFLIPIKEFLIKLDPNVVLEWNTKARMAEGHFYVNGSRYRVVTDSKGVYIGDYETNLGREFIRYDVDGIGSVYPPNILRFLGVPDMIFEPETEIVEGVKGNKFIIVKVTDYEAEEQLEIDGEGYEDIEYTTTGNGTTTIEASSIDIIKITTVGVLIVLMLVLISQGKYRKGK